MYISNRFYNRFVKSSLLHWWNMKPAQVFNNVLSVKSYELSNNNQNNYLFIPLYFFAHKCAEFAFCIILSVLLLFQSSGFKHSVKVLCILCMMWNKLDFAVILYKNYILLHIIWNCIDNLALIELITIQRIINASIKTSYIK